MKKLQLSLFKSALVFLVLMFLTAVDLTAQTPQYYNYAGVGASNNNFPFNVAAGKASQWLFLPGDFNQPAPLPEGKQITTVYFWVTAGGSRTYTNIVILMAKDTITSLTSGSFYSGPMDTVYFKPTVTISGTTGAWMGITLDRPYIYDPTKSLIVMVGQCGTSGTGITIKQNDLSGIRRQWSVGGCPFTPYINGDGSTANFGVDVVSSGPTLVNLCRNGLNLAIPSNDPLGIQDTITVNVPGGGNILDINVTIDTIIHTWDADIDATIIHGAVEDTLFHDVGSLGDNFIGTILNDSATTPIQSCVASTCAPYTGSWIPANLLSNMNGLPVNGAYILRLVDDAAGDFGTLWGWCITVTYATATGIIETITIPGKYTLSQNYPNPFNPVTRINYSLPKNGLVSLKIFDILGREVTNLVNGYKVAGNYSVDFNAINLSSGTYFYRLEVNGYIETKKMTLLK